MEGRCGSKEEEKMLFSAQDMLVISRPLRKVAINSFCKLTDPDQFINK
jgi:hypothetical protein